MINGTAPTKSKFDSNSDDRKKTSTPTSSNSQYIPPRKAVSTIALNHESGWNHKSSSESHPLKGNKYYSSFCQKIHRYNYISNFSNSHLAWLVH